MIPEAGTEAAFAAALLDPERPVPPHVRAGGDRFAVYRNNVIASLLDALAATYFAVLALVGDEFFRAAAAEFVRAHPPRSPILIDYGGAFPSWIATFPPAKSVPYLGDVARLEWTRHCAWNAAEGECLGAKELTILSPGRLPELRLILHPAAMVVVSRHSIVSLWAQSTRREPGSRLDLQRGEVALVSRPGATVETERIGLVTGMFLTALGRGLTLRQAAEQAAACEDFNLHEQIAGLFGRGLVSGIEAAANRLEVGGTE